MPPAYKTKEEAQVGLTSAFQPTNEAQRQAIAFASSQVPITPAQLAPAQAITLPPKPQLGIPEVGTIPQLPPTPAQPQQNTDDLFARLFAQPAPQSNAVDTYQKMFEASGIKDLEAQDTAKNQKLVTAQGKLGALNAQLAQINAEAQAIPIQMQQNVEGKGVTAGGLAPLTTAALRNNALKAIPLQAEILGAQADVLSAQGDLQASRDALDKAQSRLDKVFEIHQQDAQNQYNYQKELRDRIYDYASKKEQQKLDQLQREDDRRFEIQQNSISNAQALSRLALENGQSTLAGQITSLDPSSPTFQKDLANLQSKILIQRATTGGNEAPTVKTINGVDMQWNPRTGTWENIGGALDITSPQVQKSKDQFGLIFQTLKNLENDEIISASGRSGARRAIEATIVGATDYTDLVSLANTMRTNMLILQTDPAIKKFFGPQMSNADVQLMTSAGTTLNPELQTPQALKEEVTRIKDLVSRARMSLDGVTQYGTTPSGTRVGLYPDGTIRDIEGNQYDQNGKKI